MAAAGAWVSRSGVVEREVIVGGDKRIVSALKSGS